MGIISSLFGGTPVNNLDSFSFNEKSKIDKDSILLDVRTLEEHRAARIPNSILIDIYKHDFLSNIENLDRTKSYYIYCRSGSRSFTAAQQMMKMGFEKVYNLQNGIIDWRGEVEQG